MTSVDRLRLALLLALLAWPLVVITGQPQENPRLPDPKIVQVGMTLGQVRELLGPPQSIARQVFYHGAIEQWAYQGKPIERVEFHFQAGREPKVRAVFTSATPR